ncbi:hypothetical protein ABEQ76_05525 [Bacillus velezensis]|uniref:hypothetical protein n=1 Tax=Bacillus velezensis TaxID=492670 RepID=UPI002889DC75|nr:hypothetical protein [Bacillus velezensis]WNJ14008.1 hypothetical protein RJY17_01645 [Bacillus velezensis]
MDAQQCKHFLMTTTDRELNNFLHENFTKQTEGRLIEWLNLLRELDQDCLIYMIARMNRIESQFDHSKYLASITAIVALLINLYVKIHVVFGVIMGLILIPLLIYMITKESPRRVNAVFFKSLLEQVKAEKDK